MDWDDLAGQLIKSDERIRHVLIMKGSNIVSDKWGIKVKPLTTPEEDNRLLSEIQVEYGMISSWETNFGKVKALLRLHERLNIFAAEYEGHIVVIGAEPRALLDLLPKIKMLIPFEF